ncbi:sigma-54 interaction domain-containing protein [Clostridium lundense]|uniref:sigma-54 interaction domain-containing protein n=1 Tax=Clostridium lundense TaxID=319475 RepID=UPI000687CD41|nr:sigma-54-dependent Fis family transcriptional regulator [Clostridium lundense]
MFYEKDNFKLIDMNDKSNNFRTRYMFDNIVTVNKEMIRIIDQGKKIASSKSTVLIEGESGTGKEVFAQSIHNYSSRKDKPFIPINCGAIPNNLIESIFFGYEEGAFTGAKRGGAIGKFEMADGGTIFLDEIGELSLFAQVKLLRILQEEYIVRIGGNRAIPVDVRIIAATNKNLKEEVRKNRFREDLYYRLRVIPLTIPPLRQRKDDINPLVEHFLKKKSLEINKQVPKIREDLHKKILIYDWPGNVRELENYIENLVNFDGDSSFDLEEDKVVKESNHLNTCSDYLCSLEELEKRAITYCMDRFDNNVSRVSKVLGISRNTLYNKLNKYNINR